MAYRWEEDSEKGKMCCEKVPPKGGVSSSPPTQEYAQDGEGVGLLNKASDQIRMQGAYRLVRVRGEKGPF